MRKYNKSVSFSNKSKIRNRAIEYLSQFGNNIRTKFSNISGKTGQYKVPNELYQKRTHRKNRVLISWNTVKNNNLTMNMLETFYGGVVVEFLNNDYFDSNNKNIKLFNDLVNLLGSDNIVSSMISIRNEDGTSASSIQRESFDKLQRKFPNYNNLLIKRKSNILYSGIGNDKWEGFIYYSIKGGQQQTYESHKNMNPKPQLFNPSCEYANEYVSLDIDLVMLYFAFYSVPDNKKNDIFNEIITEIEYCLYETYYDKIDFDGCLLKYCKNHPSLLMFNNILSDSIRLDKIEISDFDIKTKKDISVDFSHNEAVNEHKYYFDKRKQCILSAARPTNVFWLQHLSNMMQQNSTLEEYFKNEKEIVKKREQLLKKQPKLLS